MANKKKKSSNSAFLEWCTDEKYIERKSNGNYEKVKRFVSLPHSLLRNKAFQSLSSTAIVIYVHMLDWSCQQQEIIYPYTLVKDIVSNKTFYKCIDELEEKGFIKTIEKGSFNHKPNKYKFVGDWKNKS